MVRPRERGHFVEDDGFDCVEKNGASRSSAPGRHVSRPGDETHQKAHLEPAPHQDRASERRIGADALTSVALACNSTATMVNPTVAQICSSERCGAQTVEKQNDAGGNTNQDGISGRMTKSTIMPHQAGATHT